MPTDWPTKCGLGQNVNRLIESWSSMPDVKYSLRDLASKIESVSREHPAFSQAHEIVYHCTGYLNALARIAEINQDAARPSQLLAFDYVNYKGEQSRRAVHPLSIRWGTSEWYKEPQWLLMCFDLGKKDRREFAINRMTNVEQTDRP